MSWRTSLLLTAGWTSLGCNAIAGIDPPLDRVDAGTAPPAPTPDAGRPSEAGAPRAEVTAFFGEWAGPASFEACGNSDSLDLRLSIRGGSDSDLVVTLIDQATACALAMNVSGAVATAPTGQTCTRAELSNLQPPQPATFVSASLTISGGRLAFASAGRVPRDSGVCAFTERSNEPLTKL